MIIFLAINSLSMSANDIVVTLSEEDRIGYFNALNESMALSHWDKVSEDFLGTCSDLT